MRVIAVINQKGGVAKTTTTANLASALARSGKRVTAIDLDPQGHLATYLGVNERRLAGVDRLLLADESLSAVTIDVRDNLTLVPAGSNLDAVEQMTNGRLAKSKLLKQAINESLTDQDYVLMDCPPASGLLDIFALYAAKEVLIPVNGDYLSLHGLSHFIGTLKKVESVLGHKIPLHIALTRFHPRRRLARDVMQKLLEYFPERILATPVRETAALAECPSFGNRGVAIFAKVCFGHPSPSKQQKLHATVYACGAPTVLRSLRNHLFAALHNSLSDSTPT